MIRLEVFIACWRQRNMQDKLPMEFMQTHAAPSGITNCREIGRLTTGLRRCLCCEIHPISQRAHGEKQGVSVAKFLPFRNTLPSPHPPNQMHYRRVVYLSLQSRLAKSRGRHKDIFTSLPVALARQDTKLGSEARRRGQICNQATMTSWHRQQNRGVLGIGRTFPRAS